MRKASRLLLIVSVLLLFSPLALRADTVTENISIAIGGNATNFFESDAIAKFDPTLGTLTSFSVLVTGTTTWTATIDPSGKDTVSFSLSDTTVSQTWATLTSGPDSITPYLTGNNTLGSLGAWTGTGSNIFILATVSGNSSDTFSNAALTGTLTYNYTPASPVPEPSSVLLLGAGLLGLAVVGGFKRRAA